MKRIHVYFLILPVLFILLPILSEAYDTDLEKDLQKRLEESSVVVNRAIEKLRSGNSITKEIIELKAKAEDIKASHFLLQERFRMKEEELMNQGEKAKQRHRIMSEGYHKAIEEYLSLIDSLPPEGTISQSQLRNLTVFLDKILHKKKRPILGSLPYRNLNYPSKEPSSDPPIKPAYKGGNKIVTPDDLKSTEEAPISEEIANMAQSLNWNPVSIYEYVKNNIETEWYWGCMKGVEETLHQKSGNDCDQATLLIALLRASGFPSRYVRGTIEFFAGRDEPINKIKNLLGIDDPWKIAEFFQKAGIPYTTIIKGGKISNFQIEHIWVESQIPYANYRGAIIDEQGKTWLGLDTSIKVKNYQYNNPIDIFQDMSLSKIRDEYLSVIQTQTPLEYTKTKIENHLTQSHPDKTYNDLLQSKTLPPEVMNILPASMQFDQKKITHEYTEIPDELKHRIKFTASNTNNSELFTITLDTLNLSNQKIALSYEPETVEDQQIIDSYGGLDNTPAYLVRLRPVLKVNGERMIVAKDGLPMGADYNLTIELISPNGVERITNTYIVGNLSAIGVVAQKTHPNIPSPPVGEGEGEGEKDAEQILHEEAISYIDRWNKAEEELTSLIHLTFTRPIPTVATVGGVIDVTYVLDTPHGFEWKGVYVDAALRAIETVPSPLAGEGAGDKQKTFMGLSALQGSVLEHRIFEDDFQVESISTAKLFSIVGSRQNTADSVEILTIDKTNIFSILPTLPFDENILEDIQNSVNQNLKISIPQSEISHEDWTGTGYIKENPETKESGWMLSGMIAGGMTAVLPDKWTNQALREKLGKPFGNELRTVVITSPENGSTVMTSPITVEGIVLDTNAKVLVNGVEAIVDGNTFTAYGITLNRGMNVITANATNKAGKQTSGTITIKYEIPIIVYITFPYDGANLSVTPIDIEGIVSDPTASVNVNGTSATVSSNGMFIATGIPLSEGGNQIKAQANNIDGKTNSHTINVNYTAEQVNPISIFITSPEANATINRPTVIVRGTVTTEAEEISIKVNGIIAETYGNQFVANGVPLVEGNNVIIANALGSNGAIGRAEITVKAVTTGPYITLSSNITSGIQPLTPYFSVSTEILNPVTNYEMDFEGDGVVDYTGSTFEDISHTYTTEGIFYPTLTITDDQGNTYSDTIAITVLNKDEIDALLKGKWEGMKAELVNGNIEGALKFFVERSKERYRSIFEALKDQLPVILGTFIEFNIVNVYDIIAEYEIVANENGQLYSYPGVFIKNGNGIWKFKDF